LARGPRALPHHDHARHLAVAREDIEGGIRLTCRTASRATSRICGGSTSFAEFERALILERQREGNAAAKARGAYKGRKHALTPEKAHQLRQRVAAGEKKAALAREFGISRETGYSYLQT
jgi:DNA invertase Pin-like site-specific DNA recombinase